MTEKESLFLFLRQKAQFIPDGFRDDDGVWHVGPHQAEYLDALDRLEGAIHAAVSFTYIDTEAAALEAVTKPDPETPDFEVGDGFGI